MTWNLEEAIAYYGAQGAPGDQSVLVALLREIQRENGGIPGYMLTRAAESYGIKEGILLALVKRIPSLRLAEGHCLEICAGPNCGKHRHVAACAEVLQEEGRDFTLKFVPCMRLCGKGPNIRWDGKVFHRVDEALLRELTEDL